MTRDRSPELDAFVEEARHVPIVEAFERCGYSVSTLRRAGGEFVGPCPACGGRDRFSLAPAKGVFNCRGAEGGDAIKLARHLTGEDFLDACEILTGRERPGRDDGDDAARAERRSAAQRKLEDQRRQAAIDEAAREAEQNRYREREQDRCRDIWREAGAFGRVGPSARAYLLARGLDLGPMDGVYLRTHDRLGFFAKPERGPSVQVYQGPAMVASFVVPDVGRWRQVGIHITWLDLDRAPKFRPDIADPATGEMLPTKKMRGTKAGGLIPVHGLYSRAERMVVGEGIETVIGFAAFDGWRADTFYCAAGDLGNLCGRAIPGNSEPGSRIRHPTAKRVSTNGVRQPVYVPGLAPDMGSPAVPVPAHVGELVLLGDGDSETVMTRAALKRGCARHAREGRVVRPFFAPAGMDWGEYRFEGEAA